MKKSALYADFVDSLAEGRTPKTLPILVKSSIVGLQLPSSLNLMMSRFPKGLSSATYP
jgi:hypothetical protein